MTRNINKRHHCHSSLKQYFVTEDETVLCCGYVYHAIHRISLWQQASGTCYSDITMCAYLSQHKEMTTTTEQLTE